jgi:hypothetical protein
MTSTVKRLAIWLFVAFVVYTILASPDKAAELVRASFDGLSTAGDSLAKFFDALVSS